jgi:hypothetical protein
MTSKPGHNPAFEDELPETAGTDHPALPDAEPPEKLSALAGEYIGLTLAGGLVAGLLIGALLPRAVRRKRSAGAGKLAAKAGEVGLALATQALSRAGTAVREGREKAIDMGEMVSGSVAEHAAPVIASATRVIGERAEKALDTGATVARKAADMVTKLQSRS